MAVKYINAQLGGVDGHPVALKTCFIASAEEEGTTCGPWAGGSGPRSRSFVSFGGYSHEN